MIWSADKRRSRKGVPRGHVTPVEQRLREAFRVDPNGCWIWTRTPDPQGYGQFSIKIDGKWRTRAAHIVSYETFVGPVPPDLVLDHLCRTPLCVNPEHLEPVTLRENLARGAGYGGALRTTCSNGHPYTEGCCYLDRQGARKCRTCSREQRRQWRARKRADDSIGTTRRTG